MGRKRNKSFEQSGIPNLRRVDDRQKRTDLNCSIKLALFEGYKKSRKAVSEWRRDCLRSTSSEPSVKGGEDRSVRLRVSFFALVHRSLYLDSGSTLANRIDRLLHGSNSFHLHRKQRPITFSPSRPIDSSPSCHLHHLHLHLPHAPCPSHRDELPSSPSPFPPRPVSLSTSSSPPLPHPSKTHHALPDDPHP